MSPRTPALVLGGTGYVAGELLRLLAGHPHFELAGILSDSQAGGQIAQAFPHLCGVYPERRFCNLDELEALIRREPQSALFSAAPHGAAAATIDRLLKAAEEVGARVHCVDISADFRYPNAALYGAVYGQAHGAPARIADFTCALPEHLDASPTPHVAHPGCFATAALLAIVPLLSAGLTESTLFASGVTGSTGSGRKPVEGTHHPRRHGDLYAYNPLTHRHVPEILACAEAATGVAADLRFVPLSGPFARGIHMTVQGRLRKAMTGAGVRAAFAAYYANRPFVRVVDGMPRIKDVVASNYAHLGVAADGATVAVMSVVDNLHKGAAGGAMQWMNRLFGLDERAGLTAPAPGWT
ncbi:MAG TPA: N-acetyl-gamma-glutamyl-phosphate reductase [Steroidobacteraceae bacterium]|nr:N-acetyl-gamma-glutamyl-phosphate reductase [Steroidobacteraceae bacterium]